MKTSTEIASAAKIIGEEKAVEYIAKAEKFCYLWCRNDTPTPGVIH